VRAGASTSGVARSIEAKIAHDAMEAAHWLLQWPLAHGRDEAQPSLLHGILGARTVADDASGVARQGISER